MGLFEDVGTGIYDFASDTMDNIGNGISGINDFTRKHIPGVREVEDAIHGLMTGGWISYALLKPIAKLRRN